MKANSESGYTGAMGRIQLVTRSRTQQELADFLGITQASVSDSKKRKTIPSDWLLILWRKKGVNPDWILTGQGARWLQPVDTFETSAVSVAYIKEVCPPERCSMEELILEIIRRIFRRNSNSGKI